MPIEASGYVINISCSTKHMTGVGKSTQFFGETKRDCMKNIKEAGWEVKRDGSTVCPRCASYRKVYGGER